MVPVSWTQPLESLPSTWSSVCLSVPAHKPHGNTWNKPKAQGSSTTAAGLHCTLKLLFSNILHVLQWGMWHPTARASNTAREFLIQGPSCHSGGYLLEFATESFRASYIPKSRSIKCRLCCPRQWNSKTLCYLYTKCHSAGRCEFLKFLTKFLTP